MTLIQEIFSLIAVLNGQQFENLTQEILKEAGFSDVIKQSAGSQGGFDIKAKLNRVEWRFEAKHKNEALTEKDIADKFDQIEASPGNTEYYIIVTNTHLSNNLKESIRNHRNKWYIDLDYWSECNDKFAKLILSYPEAIIRELSPFDPLATQLRKESKEYLTENKSFLEEELHHLLKSSNRFSLLQRTADSISKSQYDHVRPPTTFGKLISRKSADAAFDQFKKTNAYSCLFLIAKEQIGKSSLMRLWADSVREDNIVFFFDASNFCSANWIEKFQDTIYAEIERDSASSLQYPQYLSTVFERIQSRLQAKNASIYVFLDALNAADKGDVEKFFESEQFKKSLGRWHFNWIFSCRESTWALWKDSFMLPWNPLEYDLSEFSDEELASALLTHKVDKSNVPHWLWQKLKWPGVLRICEIIQAEHPRILKDTPEMTLAEISLMFIKERLDDFARLHPGGRQLSREGVEEVLIRILELFSEQGYRSLPFGKLKTVDDFHPHDLVQNSWNILLQQGFLTRGQDSDYELGNDWGVILIGKYLIDACMRSDVTQADQSLLIDLIFDGIAPLSPEGRISADDSNKLEAVLWFALHYAKTQKISESIFRTLINNLLASQNLHHDSMSETAAQLFPDYSIRYIASLSDDSKALYMREGLQRVPSNIVIPEVIKVFPEASDDVKLQFAILLKHYKDSRYLDDIYSLIDKDLLPTDERKRIHVERNLYDYLNEYPDECCLLIQSRFESRKIHDIESAVYLIGFNGSSIQIDLLRALTKCLSGIGPISLRAMGHLRMTEVESIAMDILLGEHDLDLHSAAIEALGHVQSQRFLDWCKTENNLWQKQYYPQAIRSLQLFESSEAYDFIISLELRQDGWIPFISFYTQNRLRRLEKEQFNKMIAGIIANIELSDNTNKIWRGLHNISSLNSKRYHEWWIEYRGTKIPRIIADMARSCAKPEYFSSRSQTLGSMAIDEAFKVLDLIGDRTVFIALLLDLMKKEIPELFVFKLVSYVIKYINPSFKDALISMLTQAYSKTESESIRDLVERKAIECLTYIAGDDVFEIILEKRDGRYSDNENDLSHFKTDYALEKIRDVLSARDESKFASAYFFLWYFMAEEAIDPCLEWLVSLNRDDWKHKYLLRLLFRFENPKINEQLIAHLGFSAILLEIGDMISYSEAPQIHGWFKIQIAQYEDSQINFSEEGSHRVTLKWIYRNSYKECKEYLKQFIIANERDCLMASSLVSMAYRIVGKLQFWEFLESIKDIYFRLNPNWSTTLIEATLTVVYGREPEWAWNEFLKFWDRASDSLRKEAITWVEDMLSERAVTWLIDIYPNVGDFFNDEKEIRKRIRDMCNNKLTQYLKEFAIRSLERKASSHNTKDRIGAAICSGLFGDEVYKKFALLLADECVRVRELYQYAAIADEVLGSI